ncbi:hypothetical protein U9M48_032088 [Paspalum notatum var. saurae]|uniref:ATP-dependent DNA helicase n=1 Tax=Paspalum notatum var. saurae TaxID=547442 RepID=A0AAQ3X535_PASNO
MGKDINTYPLPKIIDGYDDARGAVREEYEERIMEPTTQDIALKDSLNEEQKAAYDKILATVDTDQGGVFFVDGPGGTRNTYLYKALLATVRSQDKIAVATATSGVAASIMPGGRTAHSRFKIPLVIDDGVVCSFTKQSGTAKLLQKASLIIWGEASMTKRQAVEALDNSLRDIMDRPRLLFGGKTIVFGGDFRQILPVIRKGTRAQIVSVSPRKSYIWESMTHLKLVRNIRAQSDPWFAEYLLRIGDGTEKINSGGEIRLLDEVCVPYTGNDIDLDGLIDCIFLRLDENMSNPSYITSRAILSTRNDWVDMINMRMIGRFQGDQMVYHSFDSAVDDPHNYYPSKFLNTFKIGCPIILLRNIDPANGLCNGTRLVVRGFQRNSIDAEIVLGQHAGKRIFLPHDEMFPFQFRRKQFPVRLGFAITVNKAQGQTIPNVGVYLPEPVFSHGQLYVAPGDVVEMSGIFLPMPYYGFRTMRAGLVADTYLEAMSVTHFKKKYEDKLARSLAPEIFGHEDVKKALLLLLVGAPHRKLADNQRRPAHMLDGRSWCCKESTSEAYHQCCTKRSVHHWSGSSGVSLTAVVQKDPVTNEFILEGGALVLNSLHSRTTGRPMPTLAFLPCADGRTHLLRSNPHDVLPKFLL